MTVDIEKLEALAKAAPEGPWFGPEYAPGTSHVFDVDLGTLLHYESISTEQDACLRYVAAANPAAVLELIQTIRDLQSSVQGLKTGYEAYERVNAELRAECEALRKDSARYQWLREPEAGNIEVVEWIGPHAASLVGDDLDSVVDAAMSKEASHD